MRAMEHVDQPQRHQKRGALTTVMQPSRAEYFVENLEIERLGSGHIWQSGQSAGFEALTMEQSASANVDAASLVTFVDGLSSQQKEDVLNSTLLAQLVANRQHDRERDTGGWYEVYRGVLEEVGWVSKSVGFRDPISFSPKPLPGRLPGVRFRPVVMEGIRFTPNAAALKLLKPVSKQDEFSRTKATLSAFGELPDRDRRVVIFESSSHSSSRGNFQIVIVRLATDGSVRMTIAAFFFQTDESVKRVLSFNFGKLGTQMFQACHVMELDQEAYSQVRGRVIEQLGDQASVFIDDLMV